jgi:hypothetical protein
MYPSEHEKNKKPEKNVHLIARDASGSRPFRGERRTKRSEALGASYFIEHLVLFRARPAILHFPPHLVDECLRVGICLYIYT